MKLLKNKLTMQKLDLHLKVFDAECHTLDSLLVSDKQSMKDNSTAKNKVKRISRYSRGNPKIRTGKNISTSSSRHELLYKDAEEINHRLSLERNKKEEEEMKACTFHPKISEFRNSRAHFRPHSNDVQRKYLLSSLERLIPSKDQLELKNKVSEAHKRKTEQEELEKCTFKPEFVQGIVDWQNKVQNLPGIDNHVRRMKESQDEVKRK